MTFALYMIAAFGILALARGQEVSMMVSSLIPDKRSVRATLRNSFERNGFNPDWIDALSYVESGWDSRAVNLVGSDLARGGSYGSTQMSLQTLRAIGYQGSAEDFLNSIDLQAYWSVRLFLSDNVPGVKPYAGRPKTLEDFASTWNAGKLYASLSATHRTRVDYVPKVLRAYNYIQTDAPEVSA